MKAISSANNDIYLQVAQILYQAKSQVVQSINTTIVNTYYQIGQLIVEHEQNGQERAEYGKRILKELSDKLSLEFGKGFSEDNLSNMRKFYLIYQPEISETLSRKSDAKKTQSFEFKLSWSHYLKLIRISNKEERRFYEIECAKNNWSLRELQRQYDTALYTRLALTRTPEAVRQLSVEGQVLTKAGDAIKDPYILEFIGLSENSNYSETELEQRLIDKLETFLLELGTGFAFVARQKRISFDEKHFYIDLVFYNRILRSFFLIDLKIGELKHQDIGQMQMYVNYYDREMKLADENKTIGLVLCQDKSEAVVKYTLPENNEQIFASKYQTILPSNERLKALLEDNI